MTDNDIRCIACGKVCADYQELALHISSSRAGHRKGKRWAAKYLLVHGLSAKAKNDYQYEGRIPLPDNYHANKASTVLTLSGNTHIVETYCPHCKRTRIKPVPEEMLTLSHLWKHNGIIVKICLNCGGNS